MFTEQFSLAAEDNACSHIIYAACYDSAYLSQLAPLSGRRGRITLVQGAGWNSEFHQFNLNVTQFPTVFRWSDLPTAVPHFKTAPIKGPAAPRPKVTPNKMAPSMPTGPHQRDMWSNDPMSSRGSYYATDDTSSVITDGFDAGTGIGSSELAGTPKNQKQQPCKYFAKVYNVAHVLPLPLADIARAFAASETSAPSNTSRTACKTLVCRTMVCMAVDNRFQMIWIWVA